MTPQLPPDGTLQIPQGLQASPRPTTDHPDKGGRNLCRTTEGRPKASGAEREENAWISEATWRLVDKRVSTQRDPAKHQPLIRRLGRTITAILKVERRRWAEEAGSEVYTLLGLPLPLHREAWHWLKGWYWDAVDRALPPSWVTLKRITVTRVDFYISYTPGGEYPRLR